MDRHFSTAVAALAHAALGIAKTENVSEVSSDGDNDSAEIIFAVTVDGKKKTYLLKLEEMDEADCTCQKCGSYLNDFGYCKNEDCDYSDHLQTEDITGDGH